MPSNLTTPSNPATLSGQAIEQLIQQDINACNALLELLAQEREALQHRNHEELETIIQSKATHLQHLETSARTRSEWARNLQAGGDAEQRWQSLINDHAPQVHELWQNLKTLLQQCRTENEVNGKILSRNQKTFSRLMSIMRGQTSSASLYNNKGSNNAYTPGQHIGEA